MTSMKDRLKKKPARTKQKSSPSVKVEVPEIKVPPTVVETKEVAAALISISQQFNSALQAISKLIESQNRAIESLIDKQSELVKKVSEPEISNEPKQERPDNFSVQVTRANGEKVNMHILADRGKTH